MLLMVDNYDSFTYNLVHFLGELGAKLAVRRNDKITVEEVRAMDPDGIVLSPGPCTPNEAGICLSVIEELGPVIPVFGVCLGHQAIGQVYGGKVVRAPRLMHGKVSDIQSRLIGQDSPKCGYHRLISDKHRSSLLRCGNKHRHVLRSKLAKLAFYDVFGFASGGLNFSGRLISLAFRL